MEALEFARMVWKQFGLKPENGSGMTLLENGEIVKEYGKSTDTSDLKEMGDSIVHFKNTDNEVKIKIYRQNT